MEFLDPIKVKEYAGQPVSIAQVKFDGYYAEVYKSRDIDGSVFICTKSQKVNLWPKLRKNPAIEQQMKRIPYETILRCELHTPSVPATSVPTMINDADDRLLLSPFCIELWGGHVPTYSDSQKQFNAESDLLVDYGFTIPGTLDLKTFFNIIYGSSVVLADDFVDMLKEEAKRLDIEGWVLKDNPRGNCYKIKPQKTVDAFIVSYEISDSDTYAGGLKSVDIAVLDGGIKVVIGTVGTGFEGDYRMSVDPRSLINRVGEFKYQRVGSKGRLIFPRFLRWRDDEKKSFECSIDQLKGI